MILDGFRTQEIPFVCPECDYWMDENNIIGYGNYPLNTFKGNLKFETEAIGFECSKCFTKSVCHKGGL
jgi:hypothetical protein